MQLKPHTTLVYEQLVFYLSYEELLFSLLLSLLSRDSCFLFLACSSLYISIISDILPVIWRAPVFSPSLPSISWLLPSFLGLLFLVYIHYFWHLTCHMKSSCVLSFSPFYLVTLAFFSWPALPCIYPLFLTSYLSYEELLCSLLLSLLSRDSCLLFLACSSLYISIISDILPVIWRAPVFSPSLPSISWLLPSFLGLLFLVYIHYFWHLTCHMKSSCVLSFSPFYLVTLAFFSWPALPCIYPLFLTSYLSYEELLCSLLLSLLSRDSCLLFLACSSLYISIISDILPVIWRAPVFSPSLPSILWLLPPFLGLLFLVYIHYSKNRTPSHKILFRISGSSLWGCVCGCLMSAAVAPQRHLEYPIG